MKLDQLMRPEVNDDWGIKELQNCILNIMKYIHNFCEENKIHYCIMGGTALGAVRHGGFIPWDDDIDIFMTPNEYLKFRDAFNKTGDKGNFYLQEYGKSCDKVRYAKLRLNNSSFIENSVSNMDIHKGVFVDIMIQHHFPDNKLKQRWIVFWQFYLELKALSNRKYYKRGLLTYLLLRPLGWLPKRFFLNYALKQIWQYKDVICNNYFHYYIGKPLQQSVYPAKLFENFVLVDFETLQLYMPVGVKEYLTLLFGDYMKLPDLDDIRWHQHARKWSPNSILEPSDSGIYKDEHYLV